MDPYRRAGFATIGAAIKAARPGDRILVRPGLYQEGLVVANLTLRQAGGWGERYGAHIAQGRLELEGCDIASQSFSGVAIRNGADLRLRRNRIHDSKSAGIVVFKTAWGRWKTTTSPPTRSLAWRFKPAATPP